MNCPSCGCQELYWDEEKEEILNSHFVPHSDSTCRVCDCSRPDIHSEEMAMTTMRCPTCGFDMKLYGCNSECERPLTILTAGMTENTGAEILPRDYARYVPVRNACTFEHCPTHH